jgi:hypothetical protein
MYPKIISNKSCMLFKNLSPMLNGPILVQYCFTRPHTCLVDGLKWYVIHTEIRENSLFITSQ